LPPVFPAAANWRRLLLPRPVLRRQLRCPLNSQLRAARAAVPGGRRGFVFGFRELLAAGALAAVMAGLFAFSGQPTGADLKWTSSIDTELDSVEYSMSQAQSEFHSGSADLDYKLGALEDESLSADDAA